MIVLIDNRTGFDLTEENIGLLEKVVEQSAISENFSHDSEVSISIVDEAEIQSLNSQYRNKNTVTDVLSFPLIDFNEKNRNDYSALGDIVICINRTQEQAESYGHSFERELAFLTAHSMLHLFGYDHENEDEEKIMFDKQEQILIKVGLPR